MLQDILGHKLTEQQYMKKVLADGFAVVHVSKHFSDFELDRARFAVNNHAVVYFLRDKNCPVPNDLVKRMTIREIYEYRTRAGYNWKMKLLKNDVLAHKKLTPNTQLNV